ncbi:MAG: heavy metal translocating P-type ATPase [Chloroflexota bacterium]
MTIQTYTFVITGMDCAACAQSIETAVSRLDGVQAASLNYTTETLQVTGSLARPVIVARVEEMGYSVNSDQYSVNSDRYSVSSERELSFGRYLWQRRATRLALLGALFILPGVLFHELLPGLGLDSPLFHLTSLIALLLAGGPVARSAWRSLRINRDLNINVLMSIAAVGAVIIGAYTEAGLVMVLFAMGEALEGYTGARARASIRGLMAVAPNEATVLRPCIDCQGHLGQNGYRGGPCPFCGIEEQRVSVDDLVVGDRIVVKPGERIAMDGRVLAGDSAVNQAPITGESRLIEKGPGDSVFASSINGSGSLEIEVTHRAVDNTISRLIQMVAEAQERKAPAQRFVDQFARIYTPLVVVLALLVAVLPPLLWGQPFWSATDPTQGWLYRGLALLVVACPCALVISTPVSIISAISNGARQGVLFKGGAYLEALSRIKAIAFDKTGTLTHGQPAVVAVRSLACQTGPEDSCEPCDSLLALASAVEKRSEHPLASAIVRAAEERRVNGRYAAAHSVQALRGRGVQGMVNGRSVTIGSHRYFDGAAIAHDAHCREIDAAAAAGHTTMLISQEDAYQGYITTADTVRPSSQTAVSALKKMGLSALIMLTGDNETTAQTVGRAVGVTQVEANCLPEDKVTAVARLRRRYGQIAMVGDGINDTPALATADVGIAIGSTAQAMETADITLMNDDLSRLPFALRLSRATMRTIQINVALSIGIKLAFVALVLAGLGTMWMAVLADMGTSLLVTLNGMRLLKYR